MSSYSSEHVVRRVTSGRPGLGTSYTYTSPARQYVAVETPGRNSTTNREESSYSKTYSSSSSSGYPGSTRSHVESSTRSTTSGGAGPRSYTTSSEYHRSGDGPGSSFSSTSYRSPYGNNYRSFTSR